MRTGAFNDKERAVMTDSQARAFNWNEFAHKTWVIVASLLIFPPIGLFLLWRHPVLGKQRNWWVGACIWGLLWLVGNINREQPNEGTEKGRQSSSASPSPASTASDAVLESDARRYVELQRELLGMSMAMTNNMSRNKQDLGYDSARGKAIALEADAIKKKYVGSNKGRFDAMVTAFETEASR